MYSVIFYDLEICGEFVVQKSIGTLDMVKKGSIRASLIVIFQQQQQKTTEDLNIIFSILRHT